MAQGIAHLFPNVAYGNDFQGLMFARWVLLQQPNGPGFFALAFTARPLCERRVVQVSASIYSNKPRGGTMEKTHDKDNFFKIYDWAGSDRSKLPWAHDEPTLFLRDIVAQRGKPGKARCKTGVNRSRT